MSNTLNSIKNIDLKINNILLLESFSFNLDKCDIDSLRNYLTIVEDKTATLVCDDEFVGYTYDNLDCIKSKIKCI